jgi:hypothetical protein
VPLLREAVATLPASQRGIAFRAEAIAMLEDLQAAAAALGVAGTSPPLTADIAHGAPDA